MLIFVGYIRAILVLNSCLTNFQGIVKLLGKIATKLTAPGIRDQAIWGLSNFAGDCDNCRRAVRKTNAADWLTELLKQPQNLTTRQQNIYTWALRNICRSIPGKVLKIKVSLNFELLHFASRVYYIFLRIKLLFWIHYLKLRPFLNQTHPRFMP